jgi:hypothetical protein
MSESNEPQFDSLWHGGPTVRGDMLLPPTDTGLSRSGSDEAYVYVTPLRSLAATYASTCRGWVYEVEPIGEVEPDPGSILPPGQSLRCSAARIKRRFRLTRAQYDEMSRMVAMLDRVARR